ncbi:MAG TPA: hypothetical protein GXX51_04605 [Firmicutes bacterium]|nr:hypothetical protein [Bacillota bacterium]
MLIGADVVIEPNLADIGPTRLDRAGILSSGARRLCAPPYRPSRVVLKSSGEESGNDRTDRTA